MDTKTKMELVKSDEAQAPVVQGEGATVISAIERIMTDPNASVERANQAFEFYQKVEADRARKAFDAAIAEARAEFVPILKNQSVKYTNKSGDKTEYDHEDLADIAEIVDPILAKHGLSYRFRTTSNPNEPVSVTCIIAHRMGYREENTLSAGADASGGKNSIQAIGSTVTYLERYTLKASLGLSAKKKDDDGQAADGNDLISEDQADAILRLLKDTNSDPRQFYEIAKVDNVSDIKASQFDVLEGLLLAKKKKQGAPV